MGFMARLRAQAAAIGALVVAGCGMSEPDPVPDACIDEPAAIERALARAPAQVRLEDGTALSQCVHLAAPRGGELQALGVTLTRVADGLRSGALTDPDAAMRLGYLVGAVRRGAAKTPGLAAQLARRIEQTATFDSDDARARAALLRGVQLGEDGG
ncbi:MAG: hypothetical protein QOJ89_2773 [bacterium]|jgi:hypothetical protein